MFTIVQFEYKTSEHSVSRVPENIFLLLDFSDQQSKPQIHI